MLWKWNFYFLRRNDFPLFIPIFLMGRARVSGWRPRRPLRLGSANHENSERKLSPELLSATHSVQVGRCSDSQRGKLFIRNKTRRRRSQLGALKKAEKYFRKANHLRFFLLSSTIFLSRLLVRFFLLFCFHHNKKKEDYRYEEISVNAISTRIFHIFIFDGAFFARSHRMREF
jgi:hypothetical protein